METVKEIVDFIENKRGERVPESRVKVWHKNGLLPRPQKIFGGKAGSQSGYPDGTKEQALIIYDRLKENKNFDLILMELFLEKRNIDLNVVRSRLQCFSFELLKKEALDILLQSTTSDKLEDTFYFIKKLGPKVKSDLRLDMWAMFLFNVARSESVSGCFDKRQSNVGDIEDALHCFSNIWFNKKVDRDSVHNSFTGVCNSFSVAPEEMHGIQQICQELFNKDALSSVQANLTNDELECARDDFITLRRASGFIEKLFAEFGLNLNNKMFSKISKSLNNPMSPEFAVSLIMLVRVRHARNPDFPKLVDALSEQYKS